MGYFLKLGAFGFGGPIALVSYMHRDLVEKRRWVTETQYAEGLALSQLAPGPLAAQLAIYLGWVKAGVKGATLVGLAFILPSFLMVLILAELYLHYGGLDWMQKASYGISAAIIGIIAMGAYKLTKKSLRKDYLLWTLFAISAGVTFGTESEIVWVFIGCGFVAMFIKTGFSINTPPASLAGFFYGGWQAGLHGAATSKQLLDLFWFFTKAGAFVFGSGLAIVPFLHGGVVKDFQWLTEQQFFDAIAVAMITPGPVVITVGFIGYLAAGMSGALLAAAGVFLPCYLFVVIPAPYFNKYAKNPKIKAFVDGVTAAAIGAIAGAAMVLGKRAIVDFPTMLLCVVTLITLLTTKKIPEPVLIIIAGIAGMILAK